MTPSAAPHPDATQPAATQNLTGLDWATCPLDKLWAGVEAANDHMLTARPVRVRVAARAAEPPPPKPMQVFPLGESAP